MLGLRSHAISCARSIPLLPRIFLFRRPCRELQSVDTTFSCELVFHEGVDHAMPC
jgi:hypothetical protein